MSTISIENTRPLLVHKCDNFDSILFATSMGVCKHGDDFRAIATKLNIESTSSWVWPTCRWWHDATPHRPAWAIHANIFAPYWLRTSFTVLSLCSHNLKCWVGVITIWDFFLSIYYTKNKQITAFLMWGPRNSSAKGLFCALVLTQTLSNERITLEEKIKHFRFTT